MVTIHFKHPDGGESSFAGKPGDRVLDVALDNGVPGILGQCGGGCTCCTCHCWVACEQLSLLDAPLDDEVDMLEYAWGRADNSRLSCQIILKPEMDGLVISIPEQQA